MKSKIKYKHLFDTKVAGIPCQIGITNYESVPPYGGDPRDCPSDLDYYGYTEMDYVVLDRKGYMANWLRTKMTTADEERIQCEYEDMLIRRKGIQNEPY